MGIGTDTGTDMGVIVQQTGADTGVAKLGTGGGVILTDGNCP